MKKRGKPRFGCDLDGVVSRWTERANELLNEEFGYDIGEWETYNHGKDQIKPEHWTWLWNEGVEFGLFRDLAIYPGADKAIRRIGGDARLVIITKCPPRAMADRLVWLAFRGWQIEEAHLINDKSLKSTVPCDIYLDDSPDVITDLLTNTDARVLLWDRPWNRGEEAIEQMNDSGREPRRVETWAEVHHAIAVWRTAKR